MTIAASNDVQPAEPAPCGRDLVRALVMRRKQLGLRQGDVARRMHIGQPAVCAFEAATMEPRLSTLMRYARAVEVSLSVEIVTDDELPDS